MYENSDKTMAVLTHKVKERFSLAIMGSPENFHNQPDLEYRDWIISLIILNKGILGLDLVHQGYGFYFCKPTHPQFDSNDDVGVLDFSKDLINQIEDFIASDEVQQLLVDSEPTDIEESLYAFIEVEEF